MKRFAKILTTAWLIVFLPAIIAYAETVKYQNGDIYDGSLKNGKREGYGVYAYKNGDRYAGDWKNDLREGYGVYTDESGVRYAGDWKNDLREGYGTAIFTDGTRQEGDWKNNEFTAPRPKPEPPKPEISLFVASNPDTDITAPATGDGKIPDYESSRKPAGDGREAAASSGNTGDSSVSKTQIKTATPQDSAVAKAKASAPQDSAVAKAKASAPESKAKAKAAVNTPAVSQAKAKVPTTQKTNAKATPNKTASAKAKTSAPDTQVKTQTNTKPEMELDDVEKLITEAIAKAKAQNLLNQSRASADANQSGGAKAKDSAISGLSGASIAQAPGTEIAPEPAASYASLASPALVDRTMLLAANPATTAPGFTADPNYGAYKFNDGNYEGGINNGLPNGYGVYTGTNGVVYDGGWKDGRMEGYGVVIFPDGYKYEGYWQNNRMDRLLEK